MSWSSSEREREERSWSSAMEELKRGRECADRLRKAMETEKESLLKEIVASFTNTLSILQTFDDDISVIPHTLKSDDSSESIRSSIPRNRRGCYKRRKHAHSWSREDSPSAFDDGHSWRKYGQKNILRSKHPRNYYRCTHKYDQKCQAIKQVQRIRDEPSVFRTTYYGNHTCRNLLEAPQLILQSPEDEDSSLFLSFDGSNNCNDPFTLPVKQESDQLIPTLVDSCTASSSGGATLDMGDSFGFDGYMDDFSFDFS